MSFKILSDVSVYSDKRINVSELSLDNYISTENMLPDKQGIIRATKLPSVKTTIAYKKGDILISNIRPYFKKIWYAENDGGCSNDVLVIRANENINPKFLYYVLADNNFFDYSTANSRGTKMPRGDKAAIMQYEVPDYSIDIQNKIEKILSALDNKIENNKRINHHLAA